MCNSLCHSELRAPPNLPQGEEYKEAIQRAPPWEGLGRLQKAAIQNCITVFHILGD